ncbi:MAG: N-acetylmuramoyl-L-alanine amidase [Bacteroidota bacterium]|jgi:hypothetical protein
MLRKIEIVVLHHTATRSDVSFLELRDQYIKAGHIPYHGIIDHYGNYHRLVGLNTVLDTPCTRNETSWHIAYTGNGSVNNVHYEMLRQVEKYEQYLEDKINYPTLLYPINPMQQFTLRNKIAEMNDIFGAVSIIGADQLGAPKGNPGFRVRNWYKEYTPLSHDQDYIRQLYTDVYAQECFSNPSWKKDIDIWHKEIMDDEQAYRMAGRNQRYLDSLAHESDTDDDPSDGEDGVCLD